MSEEGLVFKVAVLAVDRGCLVHDDPFDCGGDVQAHHVITQQQLRKHGLDEFRWDPRNGMAVCDRAHDRHHAGVSRIPLDVVPARCKAFATENGLDYLLDRFYAPGP